MATKDDAECSLAGGSSPGVCLLSEPNVRQRSLTTGNLAPRLIVRLPYRGCTRCNRLDLIVSISKHGTHLYRSFGTNILQCDQDRQCIKCTKAGEKCEHPKDTARATDRAVLAQIPPQAGPHLQAKQDGALEPSRTRTIKEAFSKPGNIGKSAPHEVPFANSLVLAACDNCVRQKTRVSKSYTQREKRTHCK